MLYDDNHSNIRMIAVIIAVLVVFILMSRTGQADQVRMSVWQGSENAGNAAHTSFLSHLGGSGQQGGTASISIDDIRPAGNPLNDPKTVMTQGYGSGSHAPANVWGAIDLALDGDGDGDADPDGTWNRPIYATHSGIVEVTRGSFPAGNHIWVVNQQYKTGYAHLQSFAVSDGQMVKRGTVIGSIGSTGQSSGPHLDYQVWHLQQGAWVNVNPLDFGALDVLQ